MPGLNISQATSRLVSLVEAGTPNVPVFYPNREENPPQSGPFGRLSMPSTTSTLEREQGIGAAAKKGFIAILQIFVPHGSGRSAVEGYAQAVIDSVRHHISDDGLFGVNEPEYIRVGDDGYAHYQININIPAWYWTGRV